MIWIALYSDYFKKSNLECDGNKILKGPFVGFI